MSENNKKENKSGSFEKKADDSSYNNPLVEGADFYMEDGMFVLTEAYLKKRGYCCGNGCRHCPYV